MLTTALLAAALASGLSGAPELRRAYDAIFDARIELMRALHQRHPRNHAFLVAIAESLEQLAIRDDAIRTYREVLAPIAPGDRSPIADRARAGLRRLGIRVR